MSAQGKLIISFPQWQSSAPSDALFFGAKALRQAVQSKYKLPFTDIQVEAKLPTSDPRNERTRLGIRQAAALDANLQQLHALLDAQSPAQYFILGGDCGIELASLSWLNAQHPNDFAVVYFDAHPDLNSVATSPSGRFDGMVLRHLLDGLDVYQRARFPPLQPAQVILAGTREFDQAERDYIAERGLSVLSCEELATGGAEALLRIITERGYRRCYIHIDADVVDPVDMPCGTSLSPSGLSLKTFSDIIAGLQHANEVEIIGGCLAEITCDILDNQSLQDAVCTLFVTLCGLGPEHGLS